MKRTTRCDVTVIGAGVFGAWTAYQLRQAGKRVILLDAPQLRPGDLRRGIGDKRQLRLPGIALVEGCQHLGALGEVHRRSREWRPNLIV